MQRFAILGYPLKHSFSPFIHNKAFQDLKIRAVYHKIEINPIEFMATIRKLKREDWLGFNVTIPFKEEVIPFVDQLTPEAEQIGAVNTIKKSDNQWIGFNTDWLGFLQPIKRYRSQIDRVLLIGAGGAARAVFFAFLQLPNLKEVVIVNRTMSRAERLISHFSIKRPLDVSLVRFEQLPRLNKKFSLVVNTTSVGMVGQEQELMVDLQTISHSKTIVYDLIYNPLKTPLLKMAEVLKLKIINGLPMLIFQAEEAFKIWTGMSFLPETRTFLFQMLPQKIVNSH